jgi:ActR/RegA family two-component response regulator
MIIAIADDEKPVVDNFRESIIRLNHHPIAHQSIRKMMECISDHTQHIDILFLDHHFRGEECGISMIPEIRTQRPDMDIVVTTKQALEPTFVQEIVNSGVGFFKKSVIDPIWLDMEISQRVNVRQEKINAIQRKIIEFINSKSAPREGVFRISFLGNARNKASATFEILDVKKENGQCIYPSFEKFFTIHSGEVKEMSSETIWEQTIEIKAGTALEIGLKLSNSAKFLGSSIGGEILNKLKIDHAVMRKRTIRSAWKASNKVQILEAEHKSGIRRKEFYRGVLHSVFKVTIRMKCKSCSSGSDVDLFFLYPEGLIETCVSYDKMGKIHNNEDGRIGYKIWGNDVR